MSGSDRKPPEVEANLGKALADPEEGWGRRSDIRAVLTGRCSGNTDFCIGEVSGDPLHL